MTLLTPLLILPVLAGLTCLLLRSHRLMSLLNVVAFGGVLCLGIQLLRQVLAARVVSECDEFFRADALSAWMVLLIGVVSLGSVLYASQYFGRDLAIGAGRPARLEAS